MLTLHHLEYSQSFRVLWLLEELAADYDLKIYQRDKVTMLAPAEYKAISPLGTSPVITEGEWVLAETSAIFDAVLDRYPESSLRPQSGSDARTAYLFWFHAAQGSFMPMMLMDTVFRIMQTRSPFFLKGLVKAILGKASTSMVKPRLKLLLEQAEKDLAKTGWFAGDSLTAADMMLSYPIESAHARGLLEGSYPNCVAWVERIQNTASYISAKDKDGKPSSVFPI